MNDKVPSICRIRPEVPTEIDQFMQKAMAKAPEDRYSTTREFIAAIEQLQQSIQAKQPERQGLVAQNPVAEVGYEPKREPGARGAKPAGANGMQQPGQQKAKADGGVVKAPTAPQKQARLHVLASNQTIPLTGEVMVVARQNPLLGISPKINLPYNQVS